MDVGFLTIAFRTGVGFCFFLAPLVVLFWFFLLGSGFCWDVGFLPTTLEPWLGICLGRVKAVENLLSGRSLVTSLIFLRSGKCTVAVLLAAFGLVLGVLGLDLEPKFKEMLGLKKPFPISLAIVASKLDCLRC